MNSLKNFRGYGKWYSQNYKMYYTFYDTGDNECGIIQIQAMMCEVLKLKYMIGFEVRVGTSESIVLSVPTFDGLDSFYILPTLSMFLLLVMSIHLFFLLA